MHVLTSFGLLIVKEKVSPIWNVMAVIPGYNRDEIVVIGNHRDCML